MTSTHRNNYPNISSHILKQRFLYGKRAYISRPFKYDDFVLWKVTCTENRISFKRLRVEKRQMTAVCNSILVLQYGNYPKPKTNKNYLWETHLVSCITSINWQKACIVRKQKQLKTKWKDKHLLWCRFPHQTFSNISVSVAISYRKIQCSGICITVITHLLTTNQYIQPYNPFI